MHDAGLVSAGQPPGMLLDRSYGEEQLEFLRRIGAHFGEDGHIGQSVPTVPILGHLIPGAESCAVFFSDAAKHYLVPGAAVNLSQEFIAALASKEQDKLLLTAAAEQADPYLVVYLPGNRRFRWLRRLAHREGIRALWLVPWRDPQGSLLGALLFASGQAFSPGKQALAAAALLTELLSTAVDGSHRQAGEGSAVHSDSTAVEQTDRAKPASLWQGDATASLQQSQQPRGRDEATSRRDITASDTKSPTLPLTEDEHGIPVLYDSARGKRRRRRTPDAVSVLSHELLSPLTLIKGYAATLLQLAEVITEEQNKQYLQGIQSATDRVIRLLENLRDISRLEIAAPSLVVQPTFLPDMLRQTVFEVQSQTTKHVIKLRAPAALPPVKVDRQKIEQVLTNLLLNAVKYSPHGGDIEVAVLYAATEREAEAALGKTPSTTYPSLVVTVTDSGIGIPESELEHVFERFYRVDNRLTRATSGAGLGLHICQIIVEAHGGRIWARSKVGQGSSFSFSLPVS